MEVYIVRPGDSLWSIAGLRYSRDDGLAPARGRARAAATSGVRETRGIP